MALIPLRGRTDLSQAFDDTTGLMHEVRVANDGTLTDLGPIETFIHGGLEGSDIHSAVIDASAGANTTVIDFSSLGAGSTGAYIRVVGWYVAAGTASGTYVLKSAATAMTGTMPVGLNGGAEVNKQFNCGVGEDLVITTVGCTIDGIVNYILVEA